MQFYPADWLRDTRCLSPSARGVWIDLCCFLHDADPRGSATLTLRAWASKLVLSQEAFQQSLTELIEMGVCNSVTLGNGSVTIESRRIQRDQRKRDSNKIRQAKHRDKDVVTLLSQEHNGESQRQRQSYSQKQSQSSESETKKKKNPEKSALHATLQDRTTKGFESVSDALGTVFQTIAKKNP